MAEDRSGDGNSGGNDGDPRVVGSAVSGPKPRGKAAVFARRLAAVLGTGEAEALARLSVDLLPSIRVNRLSPRPAAQILAELAAEGHRLTPIGWCPDGYHLDSPKAALSSSPLFTGGDVYIQNASSLVPPLAVDPRPGQRILDLFAAPGGKISHLAALVGNDALIWANDSIAPRLAKLREITATMHVRLDRVTGYPAQYFDKYLDPPELRFDRILVDAQCSGEGLVDPRRSDALRFWNLERVAKYSRLQTKSLRVAYGLLAPGGTLVYSTCTFGPEENEVPVDALLRHTDAQVVPLDAVPPRARPGLAEWERRKFDPALKHAVRLGPEPAYEGFFVCRIGKPAD
jgi:16S rRNA (cytosine1407-C5)-methyltransferase